MKKELTKAVLAVVVGLFATACTSDTPIEPVTPDSELVEMLLNGGVSFAVSPDTKAALPTTRAVINKEHGSVALAFARVDATASGTGTSAAYPAWSACTTYLNATLASNKGDATPAEKDITFDTPQYYLTSGYYTKLVGWAPSVASDSEGNTFAGTASTFSAGTVACPIDGETDIMLSQELEGNKETATQFSATNPFVFGHLLTQIKVSAYAADEAGKTYWGQITGIKVKGEANKECRIVLPGTAAGAVTYPLQSGKTAGDLSLIFKKASDDTAISTPLTLNYDGETGVTDYKQECGYAMFAPIAPVDGKATVTVLVSTTGGPDGHAVSDYAVPVTVTTADGFKAGTAYGITLKFSAQGINFSGTITDWVDYDWTTGGGSFNGEITL